MLKKIRTRIKDRAGFTLAEILMVVLILLMVSTVLAVGIPAAVNAYNKVVDAANAQVVISTAMTSLRDRLGMATEIVEPTESATATTISYIDNVGSESQIFLKTDENKTIYVKDYVNLNLDSTAYPAYPLVSDSGSSKKLFVTYESVSFDKGKGIVTFNNIEVKKKSDPDGSALAEVPAFKVRVLTYT